MRLHHLQVQALQAFAGTVDVDFDALSEAGLFLLHGETGAGKTTLLDAVCLALYARVPGWRGGEGRERADLAAADLPTRVVLELTLRGERVRITRTPTQERPKQRGQGTTIEKHKVLLEAVAADGSLRTLGTSHDEVGEELGRLLGMTCDQFCQVVLLPQGQFADFLRADSKDREDLLARLFATERFEDAEHWLTDQRRQADAVLGAALQTLRDAASRLGQVLEAEPPEAWEDEPARLTAWADEAQVLADAERATADGVCAQTAAARAAADTALQTVRTLLERRARHARAAQELADFEAGRPERDADAERLTWARAAAGVAPLIALTQTASDAATAAAQEATDACARVPGDDHAPAALRAGAAGARTAAGEVAGLAAVEAQIAERDDALLAAATEDADQRGVVTTATAWLENAGNRLTALEAADDAGRLARAQLAEHEAAATAAHERTQAAHARDEAATRGVAAGKAVTAAVDAEQSTREAWLALREARLDGMAAELATNLADDDPCPVCGALEHPEPAAHRLGERVTAAQEDTAKATVDTAASARAAAERTLAKAESDHAAAVAVATDTPVAQLIDAAAEARRQAEKTVRTAAGANAAEEALATFATERGEHEARRAAAAEARAAIAARLAELTTAQDQDRARLVAGLAGAATVAERVSALEASAVAHESAAGAVERAAIAAAEAAEAAGRAQQAAHDAGFADAKAAATAALAADATRELEARIRNHDDGVAQRRALLADPDLVTAAAADAPDEAAAMAVAREAAALDAQAGAALERVRSRAEALLTLRRDLQQRLDDHRPAAERAATVRAVATLVDGSSSQNRKRMRLRAYVLAARLEEIALAASGRLSTMTDGRYTLVLDDDLASRGRRSGLGLRVLDGWTGRDRHPSSLSGGETFMASLALALGLADIVAAEAGGARLETLFIDEGFGSLDEGALDNAIEVLDRLRDGGRAVGVVSHVAELRQRVTARVHVVKDREGSRVQQTV